MARGHATDSGFESQIPDTLRRSCGDEGEEEEEGAGANDSRDTISRRDREVIPDQPEALASGVAQAFRPASSSRSRACQPKVADLNVMARRFSRARDAAGRHLAPRSVDRQGGKTPLRSVLCRCRGGQGRCGTRAQEGAASRATPSPLPYPPDRRDSRSATFFVTTVALPLRIATRDAGPPLNERSMSNSRSGSCRRAKLAAGDRYYPPRFDHPAEFSCREGLREEAS